MSVFLDTGVFVAAVSPRDPHATAAMRIIHEISDGRLGAAVTSDMVVAETLNFVRSRIGRLDAAESVRRLVFGMDGARPVVREVLRVHAARFAEAAHRFFSDFDRGLSFIDWTTVALMEAKDIRRLATFDRGFAGMAEIVDGDALA